MDPNPRSERLDKIKELFIKLKAGFEWMEKYPDDVSGNEALIERAKPIMTELEGLGVKPIFSWCILMLGPILNQKIVLQFGD